MKAPEFSAVARAGDLYAACRRAVAIVAKHNIVPILSCFRLTVEAGTLAIEAHNLDIRIVAKTQLLAGTPGSICVDAHRLAKALRYLPRDGQVTLTVKAPRLTVSLPNGEFSFIAVPTDDFPDFKPGKRQGSIDARGEDLAQAFRRLASLICTEPTRYYLNGVCLHEQSDELVAVATDGHTLGLIRLPLPGGFLAGHRIIIPREAVTQLHKLTGDVKLSLVGDGDGEPRRVLFETANFTLESRLINGTYPDYERVFPKGFETRVEGDRQGLLRLVHQLAAFWRSSTHGMGAIESATNGRFAMSAACAEGGGGVLAAPLKRLLGEEHVSINFNMHLLRLILNACASNNLVVDVSGQGDPIKFTDAEGSLFLLMPLRSSAYAAPALPEGAVA